MPVTRVHPVPERGSAAADAHLPVLAALYFLVFASLGAFVPWFPPLLVARGFDPFELGIALSIGSFCRALFPPVWGAIADRFAARRAIVIGASLISGSALVAIAFARTVPPILALLLCAGFLMVPVNPLIESLTFGALGSSPARYGRVRLWGSIGFVIATLAVGAIADATGPGAAAWAAGLPLVAAAALAFSLPRTAGTRVRAVGHAPARGNGRRLPLLLVAIAAGLGQAAHGPYYTFFTLELKRRAVPPAAIGLLWSEGVVAEIVLMALAPRLLHRIGLRAALVLGLATGAVRWGIYAVAPPLAVIALGQLLHAGTFALLHIASVQLADSFSPPGRKAFGQSVLSACTYGVFGGAGVFLSGRLAAAGLGTLYAGAAVACVAGVALALVAIPKGGASRAGLES